MFRTPKFDTIARDLEDTLRITKEYQSLDKDGLPESPVITEQREALQQKIDLLQETVESTGNRLIRLALDVLGLNILTVKKHLDLMTALRDDFKKLREELYKSHNQPISLACTGRVGLRTFLLLTVSNIHNTFPDLRISPKRNQKDNLTKFVNLLEWCKGGEIDTSLFSEKEILAINNLSAEQKERLRTKLEGRHVEALLKINYTQGNCGENIEEILNVMENDIARLRYELDYSKNEETVSGALLLSLIIAPLILILKLLIESHITIPPHLIKIYLAIVSLIYSLNRTFIRHYSNEDAKLLRTGIYIDVLKSELRYEDGRAKTEKWLKKMREERKRDRYRIKLSRNRGKRK